MLADLIKDARVSSRIGARRATDRALVNFHHAFDACKTGDARVGAGHHLRSVHMFLRGLEQDVRDQRALAAAAHARHADESAERERGIDPLQVVLFGTFHHNGAVGAHGAALGGHSDGATTGQVRASETLFAGSNIINGSRGHDASAVATRPRANIHQVIRGTNHIFIVFHHQDGVADIRQAPKRGEQSIVVALMQSDGWFIKHIGNAHQAAAHLRCQADALRFATRKRAGGAVEREVAKANARQESKPRVHFLEDRLGDGALHLAEVDA